VVAKDLSGEALRKKISQLLEKKNPMMPPNLMKMQPTQPKR